MAENPLISQEKVEYIAQLARLRLSGKEVKDMRRDLSEILTYIDLLKEADVSDVQPTSHSILMENIFREDQSRNGDFPGREDILNQAPSKDGNYFKVKEIL